MTKILITGSKSFIGTNFIKYSRFTEVDEISLRKVRLFEIDFSKYDVVLHLAALVHKTNTIPDEEYYRINRDLCLETAEHARKAGVKHFVFLSSYKVYGDFLENNVKKIENYRCSPEDTYGHSKYEAETGLKKLETDVFTVSIIRTPLVYGEGVSANMLQLIKLVDFCPILPFKNVNNKRDYIYIENLIGYLDCIIDKKAVGILVTKDLSAISTTELVGYISKYLGKKLVLFKLPDFIISIGKYIFPRIFIRLYCSMEIDNSQTKNTLNFCPPISTEEGIQRMVQSYKNSPV